MNKGNFFEAQYYAMVYVLVKFKMAKKIQRVAKRVKFFRISTYGAIDETGRAAEFRNHPEDKIRPNT